MTLFFAVGGVDVGNDKVRLEGGIASLTAYANGSVATAGVEVDDPTGVLTFIDLQTFTVIETACTAAPRCFTGYIYNLRVKRGPFRNGAGRVWVFDVGDLNFLLHLRVLRGADAKRPRETIDARVAWLLGSAGMTGVVFDNGMVASRGASMIDEADYRHQYHDEVWQDISTGWIFFVYWNGTQPSMFFDDPTATTNTSTLTISNVLSDVVANPTTCFAPNEDSELLGAGEDIYDGVDYTYIGDANIYRQRAATFTDFGLHRDGTVVSSRVGLLATAELQAASFLELHSGQIDTITCVVQLPASKVNLIDAGMRVSVRFSHLPGYTSFTYTRVTSRTVTLAAGTNEFYDVQLELSMKGIGQLGSGGSGGNPDPGVVPHVPCTDADLHYYAGSIYKLTPDHGADSFVDADHTAVFLPGTTYNYSFTITEETVSGTSSSAVVDLYEVGVGEMLNHTFSGLGTFSGSFTIGGSGGTMLARLSVLHNDIRDADATVEFIVDPAGWVVPDCPPPAPGQEVPWATVTMSTVGGVSTGTTAFPYADGSLKVKVDGVLISSASYVESDPATGAFALTWIVDADETVTVTYQGR